MRIVAPLLHAGAPANSSRTPSARKMFVLTNPLDHVQSAMIAFPTTPVAMSFYKRKGKGTMGAKRIGRRLLVGGAIGALAAPRVQADTSFTNFRFPATGAPTARTMPDRLAEIKNVKDFGAVGDGRNDDTSAIQAAFDAAFGSSDSPHGASGKYSNKPVFFPAGQYRITSALTMRSVQGGLIFGAGILATNITNTTSGGTAIRTNGCAYTCFRDLAIQATGGSGSGSIAFDLDWDNTGSVALNANYFENIAFSGELGINIGSSGYMGSENVFVNCYFTNCAGQGLVTRNFNALDQTIIGGGASNCGIGYKVLTGSIQLIMNVGLAENINYDIDISSNSVNAIIGCRSESVNFINAPAGTFSIVSCHHSSNMAGSKFVDNLNGSCVLTACQSDCSKILGNHGLLQLVGCDFNLFVGNITNATNNGSGLVRITTSTPLSALQTGDVVDISGVGGVSAANGTWTITKTDSNHIDLHGSSFSGRYTRGGGVSPTSTHHIAGYNGALATFSSRDSRLTKTKNFIVPRGFSGTQFDNIGATGEVDFTLPSLHDTDAYGLGTKFGFHVAAAQTLKVIAQNRMTIRVAGSVSLSNGNVASSTVGNYIELQAISASAWVAKSVVGTWTVT
jgi:Pectate lyase superfamily protein